MTNNELNQALAARGIVLSVGGCGCCGSPWVTISIDGVQVFKSEGVGVGVDTLTPPEDENE